MSVIINLPTTNTREEFVWGRVINVHKIPGTDFDIVEYFSTKFIDGVAQEGEYNDKPSFHPYIKGDDTNQSYDTMEKAIVGCIAEKREGRMHHADTYFFKMLKSS